MGIILGVKVVIHDRTEELPARLRTYAEQRVLRIARHFDRVSQAEVEFAPESRRGTSPLCTVQITVHMDGRRLPLAKAAEAAGDARAALDLALDKVDRQVSKLKEKVKVERKRAAGPVGQLDGGQVQEPDPGPERVRLKLQPQTLAEAEAGLDQGQRPCYVFLEEGSGAVNVCYRRSDGRLVIIEPVVV